MVEKDFGFVLKKINFRETSVIATLFTKKFGKIIGILKGFYLSKKEFTSSLDLMTLNEFIFYPKRSQIWLVSFADLIKDYPALRSNFDKNSVASKFIEIIEKAVPLWEKNEAIFNLLGISLDHLQQHDCKKVFYIFIIKFLDLCGFKPEFKLCLKCHRELAKDFFFSSSRGGLVCKRCKGHYADAQHLPADVVASILYIQHNTFPSALRMKLRDECEVKIIGLLDHFFAYHLHLKLRDKVLSFQRDYGYLESLSSKVKAPEFS